MCRIRGHTLMKFTSFTLGLLIFLSGFILSKDGVLSAEARSTNRTSLVIRVYFSRPVSYNEIKSLRIYGKNNKTGKIAELYYEGCGNTGSGGSIFYKKYSYYRSINTKIENACMNPARSSKSIDYTQLVYTLYDFPKGDYTFTISTPKYWSVSSCESQWSQTGSSAKTSKTSKSTSAVVRLWSSGEMNTANITYRLGCSWSSRTNFIRAYTSANKSYRGTCLRGKTVTLSLTSQLKRKISIIDADWCASYVHEICKVATNGRFDSFVKTDNYNISLWFDTENGLSSTAKSRLLKSGKYVKIHNRVLGECYYVKNGSVVTAKESNYKLKVGDIWGNNFHAGIVIGVSDSYFLTSEGNVGSGLGVLDCLKHYTNIKDFDNYNSAAEILEINWTGIDTALGRLGYTA